MKVFKVKGIKIFYDEKLDGGGTSFGQLYVPIVRKLVGKSKTCFEAFSGPAFIGFSLLANNLCEELVVADINPEAINYIKLTVNENNLSRKVRYYIADVLEGIPESERFDLVVGNPPHFNESTIKEFCRIYGVECSNAIEMLKSYDPGWKLHKRFYDSIHKFLNKGANIILVENSEGSSEKDFIEFIQKGGLKHVKTIHPTLDDIAEAYYIFIKGFDIKVGIPKVVKHLPISVFRPLFLLGAKTYKPAKELVSLYSKFYFIYSKYN